jgi:glycosyltransferase involved in cell wall biosynthesis
MATPLGDNRNQTDRPNHEDRAQPGFDEGRGVVILIPVFNDWESLFCLIPMIDAALADGEQIARILVVDDGSTQEPDVNAKWGRFQAIERIDVLALRRNLGHQRAIAIGLAYVESQLLPEAVVLMDGDGEDDPRDVVRLLEQLRLEGGRKIVFAERTRRSEIWSFRIFYWLYRQAHYVLTGRGVRVGNFSAIPRRRLVSLVAVAELWNHYAAAALRSRQPICLIPTSRAARLRGRSSMNFVSLVTHGLSAISVYSDLVGVRVLFLASALAIASFCSIIVVIVIRLATNLAIPGWASFVAGIALILLVQAFMLASLFSFVILGGRNNSTFLPRRDYENFILGITPLQGIERAFDGPRQRSETVHDRLP